MTSNLFDLTYRVARQLGSVIEGTATGGSTTTIIDTVTLLNFYDDDYFNGGTAWILRDAAGAGAAPQGEYARISDFVQSTGVVTLAAALTAAVASGDRFAISTPEFSLDMLIQFINRALENIRIPYIDNSLSTAAQQTEYTLPTTILDPNGMEVYLQRTTDDANDNRWTPLHQWYIKESAIDSAKILVFKSQPPYIYNLLLVHWLPHPALQTSTAKLYERIPLDYLERAAALEGLLWKADQHGIADPDIDKRILRMEQRVNLLKRSLPEATRNRNKLGDIGINDSIGYLYDDSI